MSLLNFSSPPVLLAPMAGLTDAPTRQLVARFGVDAVVSEMIASQELLAGKTGVSRKSMRGRLPSNVSFIIQIAGSDPELMAEAARFAEDQGADCIDINMGCPAKKVTSGQTAGAALLLSPKLLLEIIERVANAVHLPITVKTRLGWDKLTTHIIAPQMVDAGAKMLTIHGRTRAQKYEGKADGDAIALVRKAVSVPVVANGDIHDLASAKEMLARSGAAGVMIGRGMRGAPWLPSIIRAGLLGSKVETPSNIAEIAREHYELILSHYGLERGALIARKHLNDYFHKAPKTIRNRLLRQETPNGVMSLISKMEEFTLC